MRAVELERESGRLALVLEDFGAERLAAHEGKGLALDRFFHIATEVTSALGHVHAKNVIHKDINPQNIVMNSSTGEVKLIDFGLSSELLREHLEVPSPSQLEGTAPYVSPEQTGRMNRDLDYRTDFYSLGVTFFELLTGSLPFFASDLIGYVHCHLSKPVPNPREINPDIPEGLARIVRKLMAKNPDERYQSARGLFADLDLCRNLWEKATEGNPELIERGKSLGVLDFRWCVERYCARTLRIRRAEATARIGRVGCAIAMLAPLAAGACGDDRGRGPTTIVIGTDISLGGATPQPSWLSSIELAVSEANAALMQADNYKNFTFAVAIGDSQNTPDVAAAVAEDAVHNKHAKVIITDTSQDDIRINRFNYDPALTPLNVPILCAGCGSPIINDPMATDFDPVRQLTLRNGQGWNFKSAASTEPQAGVLVQIAIGVSNNGDVNGDGKFKMSCIGSNEAFGYGFAAALTARAEMLRPGAIVETIFHDATVPPPLFDAGPLLAKLLDKHNENTNQDDGYPDVIVEFSFPQYEVAIVNSYIKSRQTVRFLHNQTFRLPAVVQSLGDGANGHEGASMVVIDGIAGAAFEKELNDATALAPELLDSHFYDAAMMAMLASVSAAAAGQVDDPSTLSGAQIRDALHTINHPAGTHIAGSDGFATALRLIREGETINYDGASGPCDFDATNSVRGKVVHWQVQNRAYLDLKMYDCISDLSCPVGK